MVQDRCTISITIEYELIQMIVPDDLWWPLSTTNHSNFHIFTTWHYTSMVYAVVVCNRLFLLQFGEVAIMGRYWVKFVRQPHSY